MANKSNFVDSMFEAQKKAVDTLVENTKKMANGNSLVKETIEKGSEWYNTLVEQQQNIVGNSTEKATEYAENVKGTANNWNEYFNNWYTNQMNASKNYMEQGMDWFKKAQQGGSENP